MKDFARTRKFSAGRAALFGIAALAFFAACSTGKGAGNSVVYTDYGSAPPDAPLPFNDVKAVDLVAKMRVGWNLGNTLDCSGLTWLGPTADVSKLETAWGNPVTTALNFIALKSAGFNVVRIPVSWTKAADEDYNIREDWMERVTEIVNYAFGCDMFVILNTHHDEDVFKFRNADMEDSLYAFEKIWRQIAENFKNYDERLIFEALNEPRTKGSPAEWNGGTIEERNNINAHYQVFADTVRSTGGNNGKRFLMVNPYGASGEASALNGLVLPTDSANDKLIVSYHAYSPYNFALNTDKNLNRWSKVIIQDTLAITVAVDRAYTTFVSKGIPVVIGEFGAMNKNNTETRAEWAEFYANYAKSKGMPCVWWDNGATTGSGELFGLLNRRANVFVYPEIVDALMKGTK